MVAILSNDTDEFALVRTLDLEPHHPIDFRKYRVVFPHTNIRPRMKPGTPLPDNNAAARYRLAPEGFYAKAFSF